ncbi:MAG TPA: penicillin-binding transpeptidase domain-containing protein, partial [Pseudomonadales bacterium]|nr:penicillin-binding transpeptidase domain-containing protein [Pseudomonadales bacterium]
MSAKPKHTELQGMASWRVVLVLLVFASLLFVIVGRLVYLHTIDHPFLYEQGEKRTLRTETQPAVRGTISDRFGKPLAVSTPVVDLWINPKQFPLEKTAEVASVMGLPLAPLRKRIQASQQQGRSYLYLKRQVQPALAQKLLQKGIEGVNGQDTYRRFYPAAEITAQTVGIVNIDGRGQEGLELAYDQYLNGTPGSRKVVKDLSGNIIKQLQVNEVAKPGGDLTLTLDLRLQYVAYRELTAAVNQHNAGSGSAVLLDAVSGEILALVSHPSYNPNNRAGLKAENMRNRAIADLIEPGSTIKPFVVAAALMSGDYQPHTQVNTAPGYMRIKNKTIRDHRNYGVLDVTGIITKSSNIGVTKLAQHLGAESLWQFYTKAGIGQA